VSPRPRQGTRQRRRDPWDLGGPAQGNSVSAKSAALALVDAGLSIVPVASDGSKRPLGKWKEFQTRPTRYEEIDAWPDNCGIGIVGGAVSGNLEILDVEARANQEELLARVEAKAPGLTARLPMVRTPSGGCTSITALPKPSRVTASSRCSKTEMALGRPTLRLAAKEVSSLPWARQLAATRAVRSTKCSEGS